MMRTKPRANEVPKQSEDDADETCPGGKCGVGQGPDFDERVRPMKAKDTPSAYDQMCQERFGEFSVFDGEDSCACMEGYTLQDGICASAGARLKGSGSALAGRKGQGGASLTKVDVLCKKEFGKNAEFDGVESCICRDGFTLKKGSCVSSAGKSASKDPARPGLGKDAASKAGKGKGLAGANPYDALCREQFGLHAEFDGVDSCRCADGYDLVDCQCAEPSLAVQPAKRQGATDGGAAAAAAAYDAACQEQFGEHARFDGVSSCTCEEGYEELGDTCVPSASAAPPPARRSPAASVAGKAAAVSGRAGDVSGAEISDAEFGELRGGGGQLVVFFYAPWCGHCSEAKPHYLAAARDAPVRLVMLNADGYPGVAKREQLEGFPTIRAYAGGRLLDEYTGDRTTKAFAQYARDVAQAAASAGAGAGSAAGGAGGATDEQTYDELCQGEFGPFAVFNGVDSCICRAGYHESDGTCVKDGPATPAAAAGKGKGTQGQGSGSVGGRASEVEQYTALCQQQFGPLAEFDGVDSCRCQAGTALVEGVCQPDPATRPAPAARKQAAAAAVSPPPRQPRPAPAAGRGGGGAGVTGGGSDKERNDALCRQQFGEGAEFDGVDSCRCQAGYKTVKGRCVAA